MSWSDDVKATPQNIARRLRAAEEALASAEVLALQRRNGSIAHQFANATTRESISRAREAIADARARSRQSRTWV